MLMEKFENTDNGLPPPKERVGKSLSFGKRTKYSREIKEPGSDKCKAEEFQKDYADSHLITGQVLSAVQVVEM